MVVVQPSAVTMDIDKKGIKIVCCDDPSLIDAMIRRNLQAKLDMILIDITESIIDTPQFKDWIVTMKTLDDSCITLKPEKPDYHSIGRSHNQKRKY